MNQEIKKMLNACKVLTGSIMSLQDIVDQYSSINKHKKKLLHDMVKKILKKYNGPFDTQHPLLIIEFGLISAELNVDPAVILLAYSLKGENLKGI